MKALFGLAVLGLQACSLAFVAPPSQIPDRGGIRCTDGSPWPIVDVVAGVGTAVAGVLATSELVSSIEHSPPAPGAWLVDLDVVGIVAASFAAVSAGFVASAIRGHERQTRCSDAKSELRARGIDPDLEPAFDRAQDQWQHAQELAHEGEQAGERGDCTVVVAIAADLRAMNQPAALEAYRRDAGVAACLP